MPRRGPRCKLGYHCVFNLILWVLYTGMQWKCLPVPRTGDGRAGIHYTTIYRVFAKWSDDGSLEQAFIASVRHLSAQGHLDLRVLHGDGTNTVAKKGGDGVGYSGHKHQKGEKILAIIDNNGGGDDAGGGDAAGSPSPRATNAKPSKPAGKRPGM